MNLKLRFVISAWLLHVCIRKSHALVFFEPTDKRKAAKVLQKKHILKFASPNLLELRAMANHVNPVQSKMSENESDLTEIVQLSKTISHIFNFLIITVGSKGVVSVLNKEKQQYLDKPLCKENIIVKFYPTVPLECIENVSGAGDSFSSGVIHGLLCGLKESQCMSLGFKAAEMTLLSKSTVSSDLYSINSVPFVEANYKCLK